MATKFSYNPFTGALVPVIPGPIGPVGPEGTTGSRLLDEVIAIYQNAAFSVGKPGSTPFGVGPVVPPGVAFHYIGADAYNPVHLPSGSFC
jgi:hypothetical protein